MPTKEPMMRTREQMIQAMMTGDKCLGQSFRYVMFGNIKDTVKCR